MARSDRATFRLPAWALLLPIMLLFLITPLATVADGWGVLFVVPLVALIWVVITRTTVTGTRLTTYGLLGRRRLDWTDLDRLEVRSSRWVVAVGNDGRRLRLPMVRPHDLRRLITVSGGSLKIGDPAPERPAEPAAAPSPDSARQAAPEGGPTSEITVAEPAEPSS
jgi:hypothetical protein